MNCVNLTGRLGQDPEVRYTANGTALASFSLAVSEKYKDSEGNKKEKVHWIACVAWRHLAELVGKYLTKGSHVGVTGKLQAEEWDDKDGNKRKAIKVVLDKLDFLGDGNKREEKYSPPPPDEDDIPF